MRKAIYAFSIVFCGCTAKQAAPNGEKYFNATQFIERAAKALATRPVEKKITVGQTTETKNLDSPEWKKELALFEDANLDKTAYYGSYEVTTSNSTTTYHLKKGFDLPVKYLEVTEGKDGPNRLSFTLVNSSYAYNTVEKGSFIKDSLIVITKTEKLKLMPERNYQVAWTFKK